MSHIPMPLVALLFFVLPLASAIAQTEGIQRTDEPHKGTRVSTYSEATSPQTPFTDPFPCPACNPAKGKSCGYLPCYPDIVCYSMAQVPQELCGPSNNSYVHISSGDCVTFRFVPLLSGGSQIVVYVTDYFTEAGLDLKAEVSNDASTGPWTRMSLGPIPSSCGFAAAYFTVPSGNWGYVRLSADSSGQSVDALKRVGGSCGTAALGGQFCVPATSTSVWALTLACLAGIGAAAVLKRGSSQISVKTGARS